MDLCALLLAENVISCINSQNSALDLDNENADE